MFVENHQKRSKASMGTNVVVYPLFRECFTRNKKQSVLRDPMQAGNRN